VKIKKVVLPMLLMAMTTIGLASCGGGGVTQAEPSTIQIRAYKGGYGTDWLHEAAEKFQKAHPEVSFDFVEESSLVGESAIQEIAQPNNNHIDLYFLSGLDVDMLIQKSYSALKTRDKVLLEPLNDIFEGKAIDVDGKEEEETIESRFSKGYKEASMYNGSYPQWHDNMYTLPWANATTGLFVNPVVLEKYNIDIPLTSNELKNAIEKIAAEGKSEGIFPYSWAGGNASGYWSYLFETWFAQYSGQQNFIDFVNTDPGDGDILGNGWKVYEDRGILEGLKAMFDILDLKYSSNGSSSKTHMEAQTEFVTGNSAFMADGDWIVSEMKRDYFEQAQNIQMIGVPILSSIGEEIGITDSQLHTLVEMIDDHKSNAEIKAVLPMLDDAKIDRVYNARSVYNSIGPSHGLLIPSYANAKDAAKLFVRFLYSNDGCRIYRNNTYSNLPLKYTIEEGDTNTPFQQSLDKIASYANPQMVTSSSPFNNVRQVAQLYNFNYSAWVHPVTYKAILTDKASASPKFSAEFIYQNEGTYIKNNWSKYMSYITWL